MSIGAWQPGGHAPVTKVIAGTAETAYFEGARPPVPRRDVTTKDRLMPFSPAVLIKQYAGRRLYHTRMGAYLTLDDIAQMVEDDQDFAVREAETGEDITHSILRQIIRKRALHG
jgi:hypothetical protein